MKTNELLTAIDNVLNISYTFIEGNNSAVRDVVLVLNLLKKEAEHNPVHYNYRILRAMHDIGMSSYKDFENTAMEKAIIQVTTILYQQVASYKDLKPLREDFGKGYPI